LPSIAETQAGRAPHVTSSIGSRIWIGDRVSNEQPELGLEFLGELRATYDRVAAGPLGHQDRRSGVRRALLRRFPYAVYFAFGDSEPSRLWNRMLG
jgi:hypothetical protein